MKTKLFRLLGILFALVILQNMGFTITAFDCSNPEEAKITSHEEGNEQDYEIAPQCEDSVKDFLDE